MTLEVIGAGFGRTGTDSMREALNLLGFGPCHHMFEVTSNPLMKARWRAFMTTGQADWEDLFEGYRSCVDWPAVYYWRELLARYTEARVILTWRDPESWWKSYEATLLKFFQNTEDRESVGFRIIAKTFGSRADDRDYVIGVYEAHIEDVMATVRADRLLVHRLGEGWEPLCAHLGVPVPAEPYPHKNTTADITKRNSPT
ncbi:MAG: sulfotransferase family protein [Rhodobiaceae bacterium]|nr:sulfotransferase family protein [Rhodobiaceae bacterium]MCC0055294.1 sulfotransferase family protein [Rhodobiaceae bacterium]